MPNSVSAATAKRPQVPNNPLSNKSMTSMRFIAAAPTEDEEGKLCSIRLLIARIRGQGPWKAFSTDSSSPSLRGTPKLTKQPAAVRVVGLKLLTTKRKEVVA